MEEPQTITDTYDGYKRYHLTYLPQSQTIEGYEAPDFDPDSYPQQESKIDKLEVYLDALKKYSKHLVQAAYLRQRHFEEHIRDQNLQEDEGHRNFRIAFNAIAEDSIEKLSYWQSVSDRLFDKLIVAWEKEVRRRKRAPVDLDIQNIDFEEKVDTKKTVKKPRLSKKEKQKRKKERKARKLRAEKLANAEIDVMVTKSEEIGHKAKQHSILFNAIRDVDVACQMEEAFKNDEPNHALDEQVGQYEWPNNRMEIPEFVQVESSPKSFCEIGQCYGEHVGTVGVNTERRTLEIWLLSNHKYFSPGFLVGLLLGTFTHFITTRKATETFDSWYTEDLSRRAAISNTLPMMTKHGVTWIINEAQQILKCRCDAGQLSNNCLLYTSPSPRD